MVTSVKNELLLYADDSVIISCDKNPQVVARELSLDLKTCNNWLIKSSQMDYFVKVSLRCVTLLINTGFRFYYFYYYYLRISNC